MEGGGENKNTQKVENKVGGSRKMERRRKSKGKRGGVKNKRTGGEKREEKAWMRKKGGR